MPKRYRTVKAKPGELRVAYGRAAEELKPDICYAWGPDVAKADSALLHWAFLSRQMDFTNTLGPSLVQHFTNTLGPSLVQELKARGYDITTLRFSIQKLRVDKP